MGVGPASAECSGRGRVTVWRLIRALLPLVALHTGGRACAVVDDHAVLTGHEMRGPCLTDAELFAALDLTRPGLERVATAVGEGSYPRARREVLAYYRRRAADADGGPPAPRNERPSRAALTSWNGYQYAFTVNWTGWRQFRLVKSDFEVAHRPIGWDFIRYAAFVLNHAGARRLPLCLDQVRVSGPAGTVDLSRFDSGLGDWEGLTLDADPAGAEGRVGRWLGSPQEPLVRNANLVHDWSGYDAIEFRLHSPAPTGARVSLVLDSEDLEFPETAQDVLDHRWLRVHGKLYDMGPDLDWSLLPFATDDPDRTREWTWCGLNRMHQWVVLMRAYEVTADEQYAREVIEQMLDWTADCPVPEGDSGNQSQTWRTIEAGIRMVESWPSAFFTLLHSPHFTPEACCTMLKSMIEHARHLTRWRTGGNWLALECSGMAAVGTAFPELRESREWRETAVATLGAQLAQQVYPDGAQFELSTGYQHVAMASFLEVLRLARRSGVEPPAGYRERLASMYVCDLYMAEPDGRLPDLNDGSRRSVKESLAVGAREVAPDHPTLRWAATDGREGAAPADTSRLFPYAGWMAMRSGWGGPEERYGLLEAGPYGYGHQHEDKLNLIVYGYGREHVSDAGYYDYDASEWRRYVLSTRGHNTLRIDGHDQARAGLRETYVTQDPLRDIEWATGPGLDYGAGMYADGYGPDRSIAVTHRRQVVFVKPDYFVVVDTVGGAGTHEIESLFHLNHEEAETEGTVARSVDPDTSNVVVAAAPVGGLDLRVIKGQLTPEIQGFIPFERWRPSWRTPQAAAPEHGKREVPTLVFRLRAELPAKLVYVIMPYPAGATPEVACRLLPVEGAGTVVEVGLPDGKQHTLLIGEPGTRLSSGVLSAESRVAVFDTSGETPRRLGEL